jgi:hypothetical protein
MKALAARPHAVFAFLVAAVLAVESMALMSRGMLTHPQAIRAAVLFDLGLVPAGLWWLLMVRRGLSRPRTAACVAVLSIAVAALIFGAEVRLLAVPLELALIWLAAASVRRAFQARHASDAATALRVGLADALGDSPLARAAATELSIGWYALFSWGRKAPEDGFTAYKRAGWVAIYAAIALVCLVEAVPLHFLVHRWGPIAAALNAVVHGYTLLWMVGDLRALVLRPLRIEGETLHLRIGLRWDADIPLSSIASVQRAPSGKGLRMGVVGSPNVALQLRSPHDLHGPFGIRKTAERLLLQLDEPERFVRALAIRAPRP